MRGKLRGLTARTLGRNALYLPEVDSTNRYLKEHGPLLPHGTVCFTGRQTAGRGRLGRGWDAPDGETLAMSLLLRPASHTALLAPVCGLAVSRALTALCGRDCGIKWPNDIVCGGRKVCGILCEACWPDGEGFAVAGIGVNLLQTEEELRAAGLSHAASLRSLTGCAPDLEETAAAILNELEPLWLQLENEGFAALREDYEAACVTVGREVRVLSLDGTIRWEGRAVGVAADGNLLIDHHGTTTAVNAGEVSVRGMAGYSD